MVDVTHLMMLEVVQLPNGRYTVQSESDPMLTDDGQDFETEAEAQAYRFQLAEELEARANNFDVLKPGGGQGLR